MERLPEPRVWDRGGCDGGAAAHIDHPGLFLNLSQIKQHRQGYDAFQAWQKEGNPGNCQKMAVWEDQNLRESRYGLENAYNNFRPTLENVDSNAELHIQRPKVVASTL
ncbi:mucin-12-like [Aotus nancymaae]|uniref:mucin-12-like n=1 Tax=Aotus nancymaae TaxID=37293 RepID=UPI0030FEC616